MRFAKAGKGRRLAARMAVAVALLAGAGLRTSGGARYAAFATARQPLRLAVLDVGKGDALVVETPSGNCLVIDAGGDDRGRDVVAPYLRARKRRRIDVLLLTHPHPDHVGGAASLLQSFPVARLVDNGLASSAKEYKRYREEARKRNVPCETAARGWEMNCGDGVTLRALAPPPQQKQSLSRSDQAPATGNVNNTSIVLRVEYGKTAFVLTGDAEVASENEMLRARQPLACNVLKVGHHGGKQSTSERFVRAARPALAIISVDANNRSGYPDPAVVARLEQVGARVLRTDRDGSVICLSDGRAVRVETR